MFLDFFIEIFDICQMRWDYITILLMLLIVNVQKFAVVGEEAIK